MKNRVRNGLGFGSGKSPAIKEWIAAACLLGFIDARLRFLVVPPQADYKASSWAKD
jgi:hypothetical protein